MNFFIWLSIVIVVLFAVGYSWYLNQRPADYEPWHDNDAWRGLFQIYDEMEAASEFGINTACSSQYIPTTFGKTHVFICGDAKKISSKIPVLLFHGAGSNSLVYSDWIVPELIKHDRQEEVNRLILAVDFLCDTGRSIPTYGDTKNCPQTEEDLALWVKQLVDDLALANPVVDVVGYSYGALVAFVTARHEPQLIRKMVLIAPASIFAAVELAYIWRGLYYGLTRTEANLEWFFQYLSAKPDFRMSDMSRQDLALTRAIRKLGATILGVFPPSFPDKILKRVVSKHPTLLLIGREDKVINATIAVDRANKAGATTKIYPNAGHLMLMEEPRSQVELDVIEFLK